MFHQILPCPFCGADVPLEFKYGEWGYTPDAVVIQCKPCGLFFSEDAEKWEPGLGTISVREAAERKVLDR